MQGRDFTNLRNRQLEVVRITSNLYVDIFVSLIMALVLGVYLMTLARKSGQGEPYLWSALICTGLFAMAVVNWLRIHQRIKRLSLLLGSGGDRDRL